MAKTKCIILSTHILEEVDEVCTRAIIVAKGKILADSTPEELRKRSESSGAVSVTFAKSPDSAVLSALKGISGVKSARETENGAGRKTLTLFPVGSANVLSSVVKEVESKRLDISDIRLEAGHLDEVFRSITK
jgi:ABC-2 type transport system ATP-binding protein